MIKRRNLPHFARDKENDTHEFKAIRWVTSIVEGSFTKRYHNTLALLSGLSPCAMYLLNYLTEKMDEDNVVVNSTELKKGFNKAIKEGNPKGYSDTAINRAFKEMTNVNFLIKLKRVRGKYRVNPLYFFNGDENARKKMVRHDFEQSVVGLAARYRSLTFDEDMARKKLKEKKENE